MQQTSEYSFPGKIVKELSKKEGNCRNSEGSFIKMKDGRIAFVYSRSQAGSGDDDKTFTRKTN